MKITKIRIIFFAIALTYILILGFYSRDFLVLSSILQVFYLLSALPTFFNCRDKNKSNESNDLYFADTHCLYEHCLHYLLS